MDRLSKEIKWNATCQTCGAQASWLVEDACGNLEMRLCKRCYEKGWLAPIDWAMDCHFMGIPKPDKEYYQTIISKREFNKMVRRVRLCDPSKFRRFLNNIFSDLQERAAERKIRKKNSKWQKE